MSKKICIISPSLIAHSGIGRTARRLGQALSERGCQVTLLTHRGSSEGVGEEVDFKSRRPDQLVRTLWRVFWLARASDRIVCLDVLPAGFITALAALLARRPFHLHCIGTYSLFSASPRKRRLMEWVHKRAATIFYLSRPVYRAIQESNPHFALSEPIIIPPGVETDFFYPDPQPPDSVTGEYFLTVGAVKSRKGHDVLLEAFGQIAGQYPNLQYVIVGHYDRTLPFARTLEEIIDRYAIRHRVHFREDPSDEEVRRLYSHGRFFAMTSRTTPEFIEGFGIVYLEAALCGLTSIGARDTGAEDAIVDGETGVLVPLAVPSVVDALKDLLDHPERGQRWGQAARTRAFTYSWPAIADRYSHFLGIE